MALSRFEFGRRALGRTGHGRRLYRVLAGLRRRFEKIDTMKWPSLGAILSVAYKEFLHIYRDRRVLVLLVILPPGFTLVFGHAFEIGDLKNVQALLINADQTPRTQRFVDLAL